MGQRSYEIYLTHMFVVFALFNLFVFGGKSLGSVPFLFVTTILCAAVLGDVVARFYSEPHELAVAPAVAGKAALDSVVTAHAVTKPAGV